MDKQMAPNELKKKILYLYGLQTESEKNSEQTIENNGKGFNALDAQIGSGIAKWLLEGRELTPKQLYSMQLRVPKYTAQFENGLWKAIDVPPIADSSMQKSAGKNVLDIDPLTGGLIFTPASYPSNQIKTIAPFYWQNGMWNQSKPVVTKAIVNRICSMFAEVVVSPGVEAALKVPEIVLPGWIQHHEKILPFQKEAIKFSVGAPHSLLGLAPGSGKTLCAIFAAKAAGCTRILVVSPLSLLYNWKKEIAKWVQEDVSIVYKKNLPVETRWTITNYDTVRLHKDAFYRIQWDCIIIDESILIKNRKALRTKVLKELVQKSKAKYCWLLSGAPVSKLYDDMWAQLNILDPARFSSYWRFTEEYCYVIQDQWGWHILANKPDAAERIKQDLEDVYFSRTLDQVMVLPDWIFEDVYIPMSPEQDKVYGEMEDAFIADLGNGEKLLAPNTLSQLTRLIELASNPILVGGIPNGAKWDAAEELLEYEQLPAIIWTSFINTAENMCNRLSRKYRVAKLTGATPALERQEIVDKFQAGELDVIVAHPGVGKFGLTLTAARTAIYLERSYNGDDYYQSLYRVRRIGTKYSPHVIHLISTRSNGANTVDYVIGKILQARKESVLKLTESNIKKLLGRE